MWPELVLTMTYIKNSGLKKALSNNFSLHKIYFYKKLDLSYVQILGSTIYIFLWKKKCIIKLEKWVSQILRETLVDFNKYTIYRVHIKD